MFTPLDIKKPTPGFTPLSVSKNASTPSGSFENPMEQVASSFLNQGIDQIKGGAQQVASGIGSIYNPQTDAQHVMQAEAGGGGAAGVAEATAQSLKAGAHAIGGLGQAVGGLGAIGTSFMAPVFNAASKVGQKIGESVPDSIAMKGEDFLRAHPSIGGNAEDILNMSNLAVPEKSMEAAPHVTPVAESVVNAAGKVSDAASAVKEKAVTEPLENRYKTQVAKDYQKIADTYVKPGDVLQKANSRGKAPIEFLSDRGIDPNSQVTQGKYDTENIASRIANKFTAPTENILQKVLETAQKGTTPVSIKSWKDKAIQLVSSKPSITEGDKATIIRGINKDFAPRIGRGQTSIELPNLNQAKRTYWANTGFDTSGSMKGDVNYYIGKAAKESIEHAVPDNAPVQELNDYLGDHYEAAKFLRSFDGRKVVQGTMGKIKNIAVKTAATAVGETLGGMAGGIGGYLAGGLLTKALDSVSNPVKATILSHLKQNDPAAYKQAVKYLGEQEASKLTRLALPEGQKTAEPATPMGMGSRPEHNKIQIFNEINAYRKAQGIAPLENIDQLQLPPGKEPGTPENPLIPETVDKSGGKVFSDINEMRKAQGVGPIDSTGALPPKDPEIESLNQSSQQQDLSNNPLDTLPKDERDKFVNETIEQEKNRISEQKMIREFNKDKPESQLFNLILRKGIKVSPFESTEAKTELGGLYSRLFTKNESASTIDSWASMASDLLGTEVTPSDLRTLLVEEAQRRRTEKANPIGKIKTKYYTQDLK